MGLNFNTIDYFISPLELLILIAFIAIFVTALIALILWNCGRHEFKFSSVQFHIDKFINQLAHDFTMPLLQVFHLQILNIRQSNLFKVINHLGNCIVNLAFEIFKVYKHSLSFALNHNLN